MKRSKHLFIFLAISFAMLQFISCRKSSESSTITGVNSFNIIYDGTTYTGTSVTYTANPEPAYPSFKNYVTADQPNNKNFSIGVFNIPETGTSTLCYLGCNAEIGDIGFALRINDNDVFGFSGTVTRLSTKKIEINASLSGKTLTGTIEWK